MKYATKFKLIPLNGQEMGKPLRNKPKPLRNKTRRKSKVNVGRKSKVNVGRKSKVTVKRKSNSVRPKFLPSKSSMDDRTKWVKYQEELHRLTTKSKPKRDILEGMPKQYKERATKLLDSLRSEITWDDTGVVSIHGKEIPRTNLVDLLRATLDPNRVSPVGWREFESVLPDGEKWETWPPKHTDQGTQYERRQSTRKKQKVK